jgi:uncharacterized protein YgiM (DUF1202 family)
MAQSEDPPLVAHLSLVMLPKGRSGLAGLVLVCLLWLGCAGAPAPASLPITEPPDSPASVATDPEVENEALADLEARLAAEREAHAAERSRGQELERELDEKRAAVAVAEERAAALEIELANAIEEVLRSKASVRSVHNRALATSRIAEVRVVLHSVESADDTEVARRLERAGDLLARADLALEEDNYGGAAYLAERASDLVRQARTVSEVRSSIPGSVGAIVPLLPPRVVAPTQRTNLREGPGTTFDRIEVLSVGEPLRAVARAGEWLQIESASGLRGWVHSRLMAGVAAAAEP